MSFLESLCGMRGPLSTVLVQCRSGGLKEPSVGLRLFVVLKDPYRPKMMIYRTERLSVVREGSLSTLKGLLLA